VGKGKGMLLRPGMQMFFFLMALNGFVRKININAFL
jgi:hypothetical protein